MKGAPAAPVYLYIHWVWLIFLDWTCSDNGPFPKIIINTNKFIVHSAVDKCCFRPFVNHLSECCYECESKTTVLGPLGSAASRALSDLRREHIYVFISINECHNCFEQLFLIGICLVLHSTCSENLKSVHLLLCRTCLHSSCCRLCCCSFSWYVTECNELFKMSGV